MSSYFIDNQGPSVQLTQAQIAAQTVAPMPGVQRNVYYTDPWTGSQYTAQPANLYYPGGNQNLAIGNTVTGFSIVPPTAAGPVAGFALLVDGGAAPRANAPSYGYASQLGGFAHTRLRTAWWLEALGTSSFRFRFNIGHLCYANGGTASSPALANAFVSYADDLNSGNYLVSPGGGSSGLTGTTNSGIPAVAGNYCLLDLQTTVINPNTLASLTQWTLYDLTAGTSATGIVTTQPARRTTDTRFTAAYWGAHYASSVGTVTTRACIGFWEFWGSMT
jgi:hypothetical protein